MNEEISSSGQNEARDPLAGWKGTSAFIAGISAFLIAAMFGNTFFYSVFLFFPVRKIFAGFFNNKSSQVFNGLFALLCYPILKSSAGLITAASFKMLENTEVNSEGKYFFAQVLFAAAFIILALISAIFGKLMPDFKIPESVHRPLMAVAFSVTLVIGLVSFYFALLYLDGKFIRLPGAVKVMLPLLLGALWLPAFFKMQKSVFSTPEATEKSDGNAPKFSNSTTKLADVAGMNDVKEQIRLRLIEPLKNPAYAAKYGLKPGGGVLLFGPPGTGKTFLARAVAGELDLPFYMVTSADIYGKYVGESEKNIKDLFENIRKNPLSVLFIDELETIFSKRTDSIHETTRKVISIVLQELDGVDQSKNPILLLGATNTPWLVDEAFLRPGRFDILAFVDLPDQMAREQILHQELRAGTLPMENGFIRYVAENTDKYSGADLKGLVVKLRQKAFDMRAASYTMQMAYEVLLKTTPSPNAEIIAKNLEWRKKQQLN